MHKHEVRTIIIAVIISLLGSITLQQFWRPSTQQRIYDYYQTVNAAEVSPHVLIERVKEGEDIIIVDVRDPGAYGAAHIPGAINIPASDEELVAKFRALGRGKAIVTYCYTEDCMASRQVGKILSEQGIYVQHLNV